MFFLTIAEVRSRMNTDLDLDLGTQNSYHYRVYRGAHVHMLNVASQEKILK
jgi:hypothetical protein